LEDPLPANQLAIWPPGRLNTRAKSDIRTRRRGGSRRRHWEA